MRTRPLAALACASVVAAVPGAALGAATVRVEIGDNYFVRDGERPTVTVRRGDTVRWVWTGKNLHNVAVRSGPVTFRSKPKTRGTYRRRMARRGRYVLYCQVHGFPTQVMNLVVR
jgi:plastocyanin